MLICLGQAQAMSAALPGTEPASAWLEACNAADSAQVLQPLEPAQPASAAAHWLSRRAIFWAGESGEAADRGRYRLYHSAAGRLSAPEGGRVSGADGALTLTPAGTALPAAFARSHAYLGAGRLLHLDRLKGLPLKALLREQLLLVREDEGGRVIERSALQLAPVLDEIYAAAERVADLGVVLQQGPRPQARFALWAPTARQVVLCQYDGSQGGARRAQRLQRDEASGVWRAQLPGNLAGGYYAYVVDVHQRGVGLVRNRVADPYAISLSADSRRAYIGDLRSAALKPPGWDGSAIPPRVRRNTDMVVYELHVRDFSRDDSSVPAAHRGRYQAFADDASQGMRHLRLLSEAGLTDVHLLPVFDFATVPESGCAVPAVPDPRATGPAGEAQQAAVMAEAARDCFNWGYDPLHFNAPEGSYASDANDGARRVIELREAVMGLHRAGLRVGMDMVYNHVSASGQHRNSVLDRIVPGYYLRYDARGQIERSTCCDNTATERLMMAKLMSDSVLLWAREYKMASFRFDLMGHQPRAAMEAMQRRLKRELGREVQFIGEGWNFGEVANGARFVQAAQLSLAGSGIGSFSDRTRDAVRGGSAGDGGDAMIGRQGWINGLHYAPNALGGAATRAELLRAADLVRVGLAGTLRDYVLQTHDDSRLPLARIDYAGQPAGYAAAPGEVVNYVENHDNQTLFDNNAMKLPLDTSAEDRARVQLLGLATTLFSQGVAYVHAGAEILRSKSLDRNSFDSGDWFNRLDWSLADNHFGTGLPPAPDNAAHYAQMRPFLEQAERIKPSAVQIRWTRDAFLDLLRIRASSSLFRLATAQEVGARLRFLDTGSQQQATLIAAELDGRGLAGAGFARVAYFINVAEKPASLDVAAARGQPYQLHPVHRGATAADRRVAEQARFDADQGRFAIPPRSAAVFVLH
jgi:pullulanase-type alpha-1,6-glucosidase